MAYVIKIKKGYETYKGGKTRGGIIRTLGNRPAIFSSKEEAEDKIRKEARERFRKPERRKQFFKAFTCKKV